LHAYIFIGSQVPISGEEATVKSLGCYMQTLIKDPTKPNINTRGNEFLKNK
jgi:hypothetical protein